MAYRKLSNFPADSKLIEEAREELESLPKNVIIDYYVDLQVSVAKALAWGNYLTSVNNPAGPIVQQLVDEIHYESIRLPAERDVFKNHIRKPE